MTFLNYVKEKQEWFNYELEAIVNEFNSPKRLKESMLYSIKAGGKRLRPILMMAAYEAFRPIDKKVVHPAAALEMVHTYSLIHDDLPAMDNDDFRRGKPTNHKKFDDATAILAGDGLLAGAFHVITTSNFLHAEEKVYLVRELAQASGPEGMVAGQMLDLEGEKKSLSLQEMDQIHLLKTGELIRFAIRAGAYLGGAIPPQIEAIDEYATCLGLIFQIQDDVLDVIGNEEKLGKPIGSDEQSEKSTYPKILGLDETIKKKEWYMEKAALALKTAKVNHEILYDFIDYLGNRDY
ncbi:geranylgeranyl diphosphate synthase type II [Salirhabdus euzebyi]|uniref:Farnesyl diphosphate synthase n=1 Tax=Salirhabdus euzebyi TaxID=394506 RepID=A0A841Q737_9BACI|nr:farnesyl diphosphate synthase [Salirhabdus euzebyi]MBB6454218.1 geranylgeranyl diphosphate synthase type II [Salirhabdus euzebyi]